MERGPNEQTSRGESLDDARVRAEKALLAMMEHDAFEVSMHGYNGDPVEVEASLRQHARKALDDPRMRQRIVSAAEALERLSQVEEASRAVGPSAEETR